MDDAQDPGRDLRTMKWRYFVAWAGLMLPWVLLPIFWILAFLPWIPAVVYLFRRRSRLAWLTFAFAPFFALPAIYVTKGAVEYSQGTARWMGVGLMRAASVHPVYRCPRGSSGCVVNGSEFLTNDANNVGIWLMHKLRGPMPGAYGGPWPTQEESYRRVRSATTTLARDRFLDGQFDVEGVSVRLSGKTSWQAVTSIGDQELLVTLLNPGCLLVGGEQDDRWVTAIDLAGDRVLVRYLWPPGR